MFLKITNWFIWCIDYEYHVGHHIFQSALHDILIIMMTWCSCLLLLLTILSLLIIIIIIYIVSSFFQNTAGRLARLVEAIKAAIWRKAAGVSSISNSSGISGGGNGASAAAGTRGSRDAATDLSDDGLDRDPLDEAASASDSASSKKRSTDPAATSAADSANKTGLGSGNAAAGGSEWFVRWPDAHLGRGDFGTMMTTQWHRLDSCRLLGMIKYNCFKNCNNFVPNVRPARVHSARIRRNYWMCAQIRIQGDSVRNIPNLST